MVGEGAPVITGEVACRGVLIAEKRGRWVLPWRGAWFGGWRWAVCSPEHRSLWPTRLDVGVKGGR